MKTNRLFTATGLAGRSVICLLLCLLVLLPLGTHVFAYDALTKKTPFYDPDADCGGAGVQAATSGGGSCCTATGGGSSVALTGDNAKDIWNFLIGHGLSPIAAAGVMGNLQAESGFDPTEIESGGQSDTIKVDGHTGYGIAQWTDKGRQQGLLDFATQGGKPATNSGNLGTQLEYMYMESTTGTRGGSWDKQKLQDKDIRASTYAWEDNYENPKAVHQENRVRFATDALAQFGSAGGVSSPGSTLPAPSSGCSSGGPFNFGKYAGLSRQQLIDIILKAPNWKPQSQNPIKDIQSGVATDNLLRILAALLESLPNELITPSVIQTGHPCRAAGGGISNHMGGLAVDLGGSGHTPESMNTIFTWLYTNNAALGVDELIFEPPPAGTSTLKHGKPLVYDAATRNGHKDHIHVSTEGPAPASCPAGT